MSKNLKKKTTRARKDKKKATLDEDEAAAAPVAESTLDTPKDAVMLPAEKTLRATVSWICKTNLSDFHKNNIEKAAEKHVTTTGDAQKDKNRSESAPCVEETRVKLKECPPGKDYINANWIKAKCDRVFIATQHPLESTFEDFWRMVFYENVDAIVAIYTADEGLPAYFPLDQGKFTNHGPFLVNNRKIIQPTAKYTPIVYQIEVLPDGLSNSRIITISHYAHWPKNGVACSPRVILKNIRLVKTDKLTPGPVLVHCAGGINRAGSIILTDIITDMAFRNLDPDIPNLIKRLRAQRANLCQNKMSFLFALSAFVEYIRIRCRRFNTFPDLAKEIDAFQDKLFKEFAPIAGKEPVLAKKAGATKEGGTVEE